MYTAELHSILCLCFWLCFPFCFTYILRIKELCKLWGSNATLTNLSFLGIQTKRIPKSAPAIHSFTEEYCVLCKNKTCERHISKQNIWKSNLLAKGKKATKYMSSYQHSLHAKMQHCIHVCASHLVPRALSDPAGAGIKKHCLCLKTQSRGKQQGEVIA